MRKDRAIKATAICFMSAAFLLFAPDSKALAAKILPEQGIAGISQSLENYYTVSYSSEKESSDKSLINILRTEIISPYANLGVSIADNYVNIRKEPNTEREVVGKLYRGCAADILDHLDGGWVKIKSGDVTGYIASDFLAIGKDAEDMIEDYATKTVTVDTITLNVREEKSTDSRILTQIPQGETYIVVKEYDEWVEILLGSDDETGGDFTGFVSKDYVNIDVEFEYAISIEEENARIKAEEEAKKAEQERLAQLAAEEEAKKAEERRRAEEAAERAEEARNEEKEDQEESSSNNTSQEPVSNYSGRGSDIASYALKFVGNPYVWGGESLTNGADCSGFVQTIYRNFGYSIPRVSADQASAGKRVSESNLQPGDLIFYTNSSGRVNHVAMYIGNGKIVHAANTRQGIITSKYNYRSIYTIRRII
jgi:cell wall-associated NlpC family hydrolase